MASTELTLWRFTFSASASDRRKPVTTISSPADCSSACSALLSAAPGEGCCASGVAAGASCASAGVAAPEKLPHHALARCPASRCHVPVSHAAPPLKARE
jgi:hypothetical protein